MPNEERTLEERFESLKEFILETYNPSYCAYNTQRSFGNADDVFSDGYDSGTSYMAYEVGQIIGLDLPEPENPDWEF